MALTKVITDVIDDSIRISSGSLANISGSAVSTGSVGRLEVAGTSADLTVAGDVTVTGRITTKEFQTEFVSASITLATGSNVFGDTTADTHQFTGSVLVTGSLDINNGDVSGSATSTGSFNYIRLGAQGNIDLNSEDITFRNLIDDKDLIFKGSDGGTEVEAMRINYSGNNVGIGTSGIGAKLHVDDDRSTAYNGAAEIAETVLFRNKNGTDDSGVNNVVSIGLQVADGATSQGFINYVRTGNNNGKFTFSQRTASGTYVEAMTITGSRVGIGTDNPSESLHINDGDILVGSGRGVRANGGNEMIRFNSSNGVQINSGGSEIVRVTTAGNVGIGDTAPSSPLEVSAGSGKGQGSFGYNGILIAASSASATTYDGTSSGTWGPRLAISNEASSAARTAAGIQFIHRSGSSGCAAIVSTNTATDRGDIRFITRGAGNAIAERMIIDNDGNVGIGTDDPTSLLDVEAASGGNLLYEDAGEGLLSLITSGGTAVVRLEARSGEHNYFTNGGNLGIGTSSPGVKLDVDSGASSDIAKFQNNSSTSGLVIGYTSNLCSFDLAASQALRIRQSGNVPFLLNTNGVMDGDFNDTSDIALKKNINDLSDTLQGVKALKPSTFKWKDESRGDETKIGFIAQDVEEQFPELVNGEDGTKSINTIGLVSVLTKTVQELIKRIEELEK